jgi:hypothetical protein
MGILQAIISSGNQALVVGNIPDAIFGGSRRIGSVVIESGMRQAYRWLWRGGMYWGRMLVRNTGRAGYQWAC